MTDNRDTEKIQAAFQSCAHDSETSSVYSCYLWPTNMQSLHITRILINDKITRCKKQLTLKCADVFVLLNQMRHHLFHCSLPSARYTRARTAVWSAHAHTHILTLSLSVPDYHTLLTYQQTGRMHYWDSYSKINAFCNYNDLSQLPW